MSKNQAKKSSRNHQRKEEDEVQSSESQTHRNVVAQPSEPRQISDVIDSCLLDIFNHLNLIDLMNVADTNRRFKQLAETIFKRRHRGCIVILKSFRPYYILLRFLSGLEDRTLIIKGNAIIVKDLKRCLQLLRCFGPHIDTIDFDCEDVTDEHRMHVEQYLSKFCSKTLQTLTLQHVTSPRLFNGTNESFAVNSICLKNFYRIDEFALAKLFPKIRILHLKSIDCPNSIATNLPHLEYLTMHGVNESFQIDMLRLNPQLEYLFLNSGYDPRFVLYIKNSSPSFEYYFPGEDDDNDIENFISNDSIDYITRFIGNVIKFFDTVKSFVFPSGKLSGSDSESRSHYAKLNGPDVKSSSPDAEVATSIDSFHLKLNQNMLDSVAKMRDLKILTLMGLEDEGNFYEQLLQLDNVLEKIQSVHFDLRNVSAECLLRFIEQSKSLEVIGYFSNGKFRKEIESNLEVEWKIEGDFIMKKDLYCENSPS